MQIKIAPCSGRIFPVLPVLLLSASLSGCGGDAAAPDVQPAPSASAVLSSAPEASAAPQPLPAPSPAPLPAPPIAGDDPPAPPVVIAVGEVITDISIGNTGASAQSRVPLTFGQVFAPGHLLANNALIGKLPDGTLVPLQINVKAAHADGSVRHAVISALVPALPAAGTVNMTLSKASSPATGSHITPAALLGAGFSTAVNLTLGGQRYTASPNDALANGRFTTWLAGPLATEWLVAVPLKTAAGIAHPHLMARFAIRAHDRARARVDVTIENNWAYEPAPQNFRYDAQIVVGGQPVYSKTALEHYHHARWRKVFWWGAAPQVHVRHNSAYLQASRALPNYDKQVVIAEKKLLAYQTGWTGAKTEPMGVGQALPGMPTTGGRPDIGLLPDWAASYLISMDKGAKDVTLGTADLAGSWSTHYRDKATDRPVSLASYPYMTILGRVGDTLNPATGKREAFPPCAPAQDACKTPNQHDTSHQPGFAYLPYLVTGDYYYLEELQFWAMYNTFSSNPHYREFGKGLLKPDQVRGQAWSLRTISEAAYITPDADPLKAQLTHFVTSNLDWYNANYTHNPAANKLGFINNGYALGYNGGTGLAPWQDDFFTAAVGHAADLGFAGARPLLVYKTKFPILRMTDPGACWIKGAIYAMNVRATASSPFYLTMKEVYAANHTPDFIKLPCGGEAMAKALGLKAGEMTGYSSSAAGYPSNMQPALAYSADAGGAAGGKAWAVFMGRSVKPLYGEGPQFAIVPR